MKTFEKITRKTYTIRWIREDFKVYDEFWIKIRSNFKNKLNNCFKCGNRFEFGDKIHLIAVEEDSNKVICSNCLEELK